MATWLIENDCVPDLVFCSPARRAVETWEHLLTGIDRAVEVRMLHDLYQAEPQPILDIVRSGAGKARTVMVVGHNPGLEELARALAGDGRKKQLKRMHRKFPTAAVAVIDFEVGEWAEVGSGNGVLRDFVRPKDLAG
jgi:phosphohistidine phosphatase